MMVTTVRAIWTKHMSCRVICRRVKEIEKEIFGSRGKDIKGAIVWERGGGGGIREACCRPGCLASQVCKGLIEKCIQIGTFHCVQDCSTHISRCMSSGHASCVETVCVPHLASTKFAANEQALLWWDIWSHDGFPDVFALSSDIWWIIMSTWGWAFVRKLSTKQLEWSTLLLYMPPVTQFDKVQFPQ